MNKDHESRRNTKMRWGKFKGRFIKEIPDWYIEWASVNYNQQSLKIYFMEELNYRNTYEKKNLKPKLISDK
jgi:hypothetical protein